MGVLDQITQMKREGRKDDEIINSLRQQGVSPKEINDALNHAQIKDAVSDISGDEMPPAPGGQQYPPQGYDQSQGQYAGQNADAAAPYPPQGGGYDQSQAGYGGQNYGQEPAAQGYDQSQNGYGYQQGYDQSQGQYAGQEYYPQQGYDQSQGYGYQQPTANTDTIVEIAEQVFSEKINDIKKKVDSSDEFKTLAKSDIDRISERVKRIEGIIDRLQAAILEKIGSYGNNLESIKKEMSMMQDSFSKALNPLADLAEKKGKPASSEPRASSEIRASPAESSEDKEEKPAAKAPARKPSKK